MQSAIAGVFVVSCYGASGVIAAMSASSWFDCANIVGSSDDVDQPQVAQLYSSRAGHYLIGTAVK